MPESKSILKGILGPKRFLVQKKAMGQKNYGSKKCFFVFLAIFQIQGPKHTKCWNYDSPFGFFENIISKSYNFSEKMATLPGIVVMRQF